MIRSLRLVLEGNHKNRSPRLVLLGNHMIRSPKLVLLGTDMNHSPRLVLLGTDKSHLPRLVLEGTHKCHLLAARQMGKDISLLLGLFLEDMRELELVLEFDLELNLELDLVFDLGSDLEFYLGSDLEFYLESDLGIYCKLDKVSLSGKIEALAWGMHTRPLALLHDLRVERWRDWLSEHSNKLIKFLLLKNFLYRIS